MINTYEEAVSYLEKQPRWTEKPCWNKIYDALDYLGHPEEGYPKIHIAGTDGKGSTSSYLRYMLSALGKKVGCYNSPYVITFCERISINGEYISKEDLIKYTNIICDLQEKMAKDHGYTYTFFECVTLICFLYFHDQKVEIAIMEAGLGGRYDTTNAVDYQVSLITNVGYDHMKELGSTLEEIAYQKIGIIKNEKNHLITTATHEAIPVFKKAISEIHASSEFIQEEEIQILNHNPLKFQFKNEIFELSLLGDYQCKNAALAIEAVKYLYKEEYDSKNTLIHDALKNAFWPGRFERFSDSIILDGGHNIHGITHLVSSIESIFPNEKFKVIFCAMKDKETDKMIEMLEKIAKEFIFTEISYPRCQKAEVLQSEYKGALPRKSFNSLEKLLASIDEKETHILFVGSLYFVSEIRPLLYQKYMKKEDA